MPEEQQAGAPGARATAVTVDADNRARYPPGQPYRATRTLT
jgi:hypothetical protein